MKYWTLTYDASQRYGDVKTPHDARGIYYPDRKGVVCGAEFVLADWHTPAKQLADCISCFEHLVVSRRAADLFDQFKVDELARAVPLRISDARPEFAEHYSCIFFPRYHANCVDLETSKYKTYSDGSPMLFDEPIVLVQQLPSYDLFGAQYVGVVCTDNLRQAIADARLLNFEFGELRQLEANNGLNPTDGPRRRGPSSG